MIARRRRLALRLGIVSGLAVAIVLNGCATLGGNVKGSFSCAAPDGICAPSSSIDDRALAMIAGERDADLSPAGPFKDDARKRSAPHVATSSSRTPIQRASLGRTQERVLRIVFQPYIDEVGWLHEASAVHAVVASSQWQQQVLAGSISIPDARTDVVAGNPLSLSDAIDRADPPGATMAAIDPNLPDDAVVAAARARAIDPLAEIKSDVAARLTGPKTARPARNAGTPAVAAPAALPAPVKSAPSSLVRAAGFPATVSED